MSYAWLEGTVIRDICSGEPSELYHPDVAKHYATWVPDDAVAGDLWENNVLTRRTAEPPAVEVQPPTATLPPTVSITTFKMLFTTSERIAAKTSTDPVVVDLHELMNDPRTTEVNLALKSVGDYLSYLTHLGLIAEGRKAEILTGKLL